tara:strand:- start:42 stop:485 length:444 start_codon:yes stop_codon:yes gene_type:complete
MSDLRGKEGFTRDPSYVVPYVVAYRRDYDLYQLLDRDYEAINIGTPDHPCYTFRADKGYRDRLYRSGASTSYSRKPGWDVLTHLYDGRLSDLAGWTAYAEVMAEAMRPDAMTWPDETALRMIGRPRASAPKLVSDKHTITVMRPVGS